MSMANVEASQIGFLGKLAAPFGFSRQISKDV